MNKYILVCWMIVGMAWGIMAATTYTQTDTTGKTWTYEIVSGTNVRLVSTVDGLACRSPFPTGNFTVPKTFSIKKNSTYTTYTIVQLGTDAFINCTTLSNIVLQNPVTQVYGAFTGCTALTNITFEADSITFDEKAFLGCSSLRSFTTSSAKYAVKDGALYNADATKLLRVPNAITTISLPPTLTTISQYAFTDSAVSCLTLPPLLQTISPYAFASSSNLQAFAVDPGHAYFSSVGGVLYDSTGKKLRVCPPALTAYKIPNGVTNIADYAFYASAHLTTLTCPQTLSTLSSYSLSGLTALEALYFRGPVPTYFDTCTFPTFSTCCVYYNVRYATEWQTALDKKGVKNSQPFKFKEPFIISFLSILPLL